MFMFAEEGGVVGKVNQKKKKPGQNKDPRGLEPKKLTPRLERRTVTLRKPEGFSIFLMAGPHR
jgi:hypothetical protein